MSEIKVNSIKGVGASAAAITVNNTDGTCTANITNNLSNRRLTINGAMTIAQRGVSSTSAGYYTVDRWAIYNNGVDEAPTQAQADVASGTTPYTSGFRKCLKVTNGNQTSGAQAAGYVWIQHSLEAQDIANCGWNYVSNSSNITLSFWVKSSVAQTFVGYLRSRDGTEQQYPFETGSLSADTWTKVTKTIPGNSSLQFDNNNAQGLQIVILPFIGTNYTNNSVTYNAWGTYTSAARVKDSTTTWFTTNDATFEITGVQLEVSDHASDFEHRSFGDELARCQRYYYNHVTDAGTQLAIANVQAYSSGTAYGTLHFPVTMRANPSLSATSGGNYYIIHGNATSTYSNSVGMETVGTNAVLVNTSGSYVQGYGYFARTNAGAGGKVSFSAEL